MRTIEIRGDVDRFFLYFETSKHEVNAYALASAFVGLADAIREANAMVNPGYRIEVVVEALSSGSFRAAIKMAYTEVKNLFSKQAVEAIIYSIIATYIYEECLSKNEPPKITVSEEMVIIEVGRDRVVVPRDAYDAKKRLEQSERFKSAVGKVFEGAALDSSVTGLAITSENGPPPPHLIIPKELFGRFEADLAHDENTREIIEAAHVEINRAILERSKRRWEFFWRGIKISAPILDDMFFDRFFAHEITIAPGDGLFVDLRIVQEKHPDTGIFINKRYEIIKVYDHIPRLKQAAL